MTGPLLAFAGAANRSAYFCGSRSSAAHICGANCTSSAVSKKNGGAAWLGTEFLGSALTSSLAAKKTGDEAANGLKVERAVCTMVFAGAGKSNATDAAKEALLAAIRPSRIGRDAVINTAMRDRIDAAIRAVEACNTSQDPLNDPNLSTRWKLIYTDSEEILGTKRPRGFRPNDEIYQTIDASNGKAKNEETVPLFGVLNVLNSVEATIRTEPPRRVQVKFEQFGIGGALKVKAPPTARGWLDITYLDRDMRISRGNKNHVFVLVRDD